MLTPDYVAKVAGECGGVTLEQANAESEGSVAAFRVALTLLEALEDTPEVAA